MLRLAKTFCGDKLAVRLLKAVCEALADSRLGRHDVASKHSPGARAGEHRSLAVQLPPSRCDTPRRTPALAVCRRKTGRVCLLNTGRAEGYLRTERGPVDGRCAWTEQ